MNEEREQTIDDVLTERVRITSDQWQDWISNNGKKDVVIDAELEEHLRKQFPCFVLGGVIHWYRDGVYLPDISGSVSKTLIKMHLPKALQKAYIIDQIYKLLMMDNSLVVTQEQTNQYPVYCMVFENGIFDPLQWKTVSHKPKYRIIGNMIPHEYDGTEVPAEYGIVFERYAAQAFRSPEDRLSLLEFIGYCFTRDTRFEKFIVIDGPGGSGKSTVIGIIKAGVGARNTASLSIQQMQQQFFRVELIGKLLNFCTDLNSDRLDYAGDLKKIISGEEISDSFKGKPVFKFCSYAKHIFATNELPAVGDASTGFYRRLLLITMDHVPETPDTDLLQKLTSKKSMAYIIDRAVRAYTAALKRGSLTESEAAKTAKQQYHEDCDSVEGFLSECITRTKSDTDRIERDDMFTLYETYCEDMEIKRRRSKKELFRILRKIKQIPELKSNGKRYWRRCRERTEDDNRRADEAAESALPSAPEVPFYSDLPENTSTPFD